MSWEIFIETLVLSVVISIHWRKAITQRTAKFSQSYAKICTKNKNFPNSKPFSNYQIK